MVVGGGAVDGRGSDDRFQTKVTSAATPITPPPINQAGRGKLPLLRGSSWRRRLRTSLAPSPAGYRSRTDFRTTGSLLSIACRYAASLASFDWRAVSSRLRRA